MLLARKTLPKKNDAGSSWLPAPVGALFLDALVLVFREGLGDLVRDVHGAVDVLDVLKLLQAVDEALDLLGVVDCDVGGGGGHHRELGALDLDALGLERLLDVLHLVVGGVNDPLVAGVLVVLAARIGHGEHELVLVHGVLAVGDLLLVAVDDLLDGDGALALELERDGAGGAQVAASVREGGADVCGGAVLVVGQAVNIDGHARGAVALVGDLLVDGCVRAGAKGLVDGRLDLGVGHGDHAGALDGSGEGGVVVRVGVATDLGGNGDVARELGEERRALGVDGRLLVLGGSPLRVSGH